MNNQSCSIAHPPTKMAGPMLRAGFTDVFVTRMPPKWIRTKTDRKASEAHGALSDRLRQLQ